MARCGSYLGYAIKFGLPALLVAALNSACATTRVVKKVPGKGGVVMVHEGFFGDAKADAKEIMQSNCGSKKPVITTEEESKNGSTGTTSLGRITEGVGSSKDTHEWHWVYKCK